MLSERVIIILVAVLLSSAIAEASERTIRSSNCKPIQKNPVSKQFCENPPTVSVDLKLYSGLWYGMFTSGTAVNFTTGTCITANYTLVQDKISVLNCDARKVGAIPQCVQAVATRRDNVPMSGNLQVNFPFIPEGPFNPAKYNVAFLMKSKEGEYDAAAVYQCATTPDGTSLPGFYILVRKPPYQIQPWKLLRKIKERLRCEGYTTFYKWVNISHKPGCKYFYGPDGYTSMTP